MLPSRGRGPHHHDTRHLRGAIPALSQGEPLRRRATFRPGPACFGANCTYGQGSLPTPFGPFLPPPVTFYLLSSRSSSTSSTSSILRFWPNDGRDLGARIAKTQNFCNERRIGEETIGKGKRSNYTTYKHKKKPSITSSSLDCLHCFLGGLSEGKRRAGTIDMMHSVPASLDVYRTTPHWL